MDEAAKLVRREARSWTVGQLRAALVGVPEHLSVVVHPAAEPNREGVDPQVLVDVGFGIAPGGVRLPGDPLDLVAPELVLHCRRRQ